LTENGSYKFIMRKQYQDRLWLVLLWVMFVAILVHLLFYIHYRWFAIVEVEHIHTAWLILQGKELYVDSFQHHHPLLNYLLVPVISIFGDTMNTIFFCRYMMVLMMGGILATTYFMARMIFKSSEVGLISIILTSTIVVFYGDIIKIRPDVPQTLAGLISIYFLFIFYDNKSIKSLVVSAVFLGISFLFLQKAIALIICIGILFLYDLYAKRLKIKEVLLFAGIFILTIIPYYIYLLVNGALEQYFVANWLLNMEIRDSQGHSTYVILLKIFKENMITGMLYVIGAVMLIWSNNKRQFVLLSEAS